MDSLFPKFIMMYLFINLKKIQCHKQFKKGVSKPFQDGFGLSEKKL
jgi:hypothetical protein